MDSKLKLPTAETTPQQEAKQEQKQEQYYLMQAKNGMLVNVPESRLAAWQEAQESGGLSPSELDRLVDEVLEAGYQKYLHRSWASGTPTEK